MKRILVAYTTNAGSTLEVAQAVAEELGREGAPVDVRRLEEVRDLEPYAAVVVGAPMIMGWHGAALGFLKKHQRALSQMRVAYFLTAMSLTQMDEKSVDGVPLCVDPEVAKPPQNVPRLSFKERYATPANYVRPMLKAARGLKPVSVGCFGGKLEMFRLPLLQMLFVLVIIQAQPGDKRNWPFIREWAANLRANLSAVQS